LIASFGVGISVESVVVEIREVACAESSEVKAATVRKEHENMTIYSDNRAEYDIKR
jgi:hypothetical protein